MVTSNDFQLFDLGQTLSREAKRLTGAQAAVDRLGAGDPTKKKMAKLEQEVAKLKTQVRKLKAELKEAKRKTK